MNPLFTKIDSLKNTLHRLRPLSNAELQRLREEFIIETTYNSNAIEGNTLTLRENGLNFTGRHYHHRKATARTSRHHWF